MKKIVFLFTMLFAFCVLVACGGETGTPTPSTYRITFDSDGGSKVETIVGEAGIEIAAPTDPTKEGYKFLGWYLNDVEYEFTVMPEINITLTAKWEKVETPGPGPDPVVTYTLTFDVNGGVALVDNKLTGEAGTAITLPVPTKEGYTFLGWYNGEVKFEEITMPSENLTLVAKWEEVEIPGPGPDPVVTFTITFDVNGGNALAENSITGEAGTAVELPTPTREGYTFLGWLYEGELFETTSMPDFSLTLVASWEIIPAKTVKVVYNLNGGYTEYADLTAVKAAFDIDYKALTGQTTYSIWHHYEELANVFTQTNGKWNWLLDYWAAVNSNSYSDVSNASQFLMVKNGEKINDYYYLGVEITCWYTSSLQSVYSGGLKSADYSDPAVQLRMWEFLSNYQNGKVQELHVGDALLDKIYKVGYEFDGWYTTEDFKEGTKVTNVTEDTTLYAKWNKVEHTLTYVLNNNDASIANTTVKFSAIESVELLQPTYDVEKYKFLGWFADEALTTPIEQIKLLTDKDVTVYASWKAITGTEFEVNYVLNGGNWYFASHDELVATFISEYNEITGKSVTADTFYSAAGNGTHVFFDDQEMFEKWSWLFTFFHALGEEGIGKHTESQAQYKTFLAGEGSTVGSQWAIRQSIQSFMSKSRCASYSGYAAIDFSDQALLERFWDYLNNAQTTKFEYEKESSVPTPKRQYQLFAGWYDNAEFTGEKVTSVTEAKTLYAKWEEETPVTEVVINHNFTEANRYSTLELDYTLLPADAKNIKVIFESSDKNVATVDDNGVVTMVGLGTVTITITSLSSSKASASISFNVIEPGHFNASYETNSYVSVNGEIKLLAEYISKDQEQLTVTWSSLNSDIATVNDGVVKGLKSGVATIRATASNNETFDFVVTVLPETVSAALQHAINSHESNVFTRYELGIGSGTPAYYKDIFGSVSKLLYNHTLEINDEYLAAGNASGDYYANSTELYGLEFITVHYTAGMGATADTDNHASYFSSGSADVSIHYVTGNKGVKNGEPSSEVYHTLDHKHGAWHAGDSNGRYHSNSTKNDGTYDLFTWMPTGVDYDDCNLLDVEFSASDDFYFEINGKKTSIKLPETWDFKSRNTDHIYNADGTISSQPDLTFSWAKFENRTPESFFNNQGFPIKVIDGQYYMGPTWWSYGQTVEGRICGFGGNNNSIGIESCVNEGSDLWYTWQVTAKLVAKLMNDNGLGIERVKGHHFFDGKDCPQPLLENDMEIWYEFIEIVQAEYELLTTYKDVDYQFATVENYDFVSENGRIIDQPEFTQVVQYTVTVGGETITLASIVEGIYNK